jgi:hypothetical protein
MGLRMPMTGTEEVPTAASEAGQPDPLAANVAPVNEQNRRQWLDHR